MNVKRFRAVSPLAAPTTVCRRKEVNEPRRSYLAKTYRSTALIYPSSH